jgi:predicted phosphodiesterase
VRTLVVSDLHLGRPSRVDLLRRPALRAPLLEALAGVDRLVILGDGLELREAPLRHATEVAGPVLAELGSALGPDGEIVLVAGNHDHGLVAGWIEGRLQTEASGFLGLEHRIAPDEAGRLAAALAEHARPARLELAYPGAWLRDDVYALHGHWADVHTTVPTFERLAAGAMARWVVTMPADGATPDDYEAILSPLYAWMHALAQRSEHTVLGAGAGASARAWAALARRGRRRRPLRAAALGAGYAAVIAALNRAGLGPLDRDLSGASLRRGGLCGLTEVLRRLGLEAPHVVWGHSHRAGPWPRDPVDEWTTPAGTRLHNTGSWVYEPHFLSGVPNESPYWPGTAILLEDAAEPRLIRLLGERGHRELAPPA